jgi:hypothetical protein
MVRNDGSWTHGGIMLKEAWRRQADYPMRILMPVCSGHASTLCCNTCDESFHGPGQEVWAPPLIISVPLLGWTKIHQLIETYELHSQLKILSVE